MNKFHIINICSDLGVQVNGSELGPNAISKNFNIESTTITKENIKKSTDKNDLSKNLDSINKTTKEAFDETTKVLLENKFPIILGGDHSIIIGSSLAINTHYKNLGIIWIDAHGDYNTFETTVTGNIHGLPLAAIAGYNNQKLTNFLDCNFFNKENIVIVGARSIDPLEKENLTNSNIKVFTMEDIKTLGIEQVMTEAIKIASNNTNGIHISYDLDAIDPLYAPGVSTPENDGITDKEAYQIMHILKNNINKIKSLDIVEYNPIFDKDNKTLKIAKDFIDILIEKDIS